MSTHDDYPALIPPTGKLTLRTPPAQGEAGNVVHPEHAKQKPVDPKKKKRKSSS
jgi:hypothetical protein